MEDLRYFHSTVAKDESQREWPVFLFKSYIKPKRPPLRRGRWYNASECRRRESNPHSRREHDFESCASAYSATSASWASCPCRMLRNQLALRAPKYTTHKTMVK